MNRREFLTAAVAGLASLVVPVGAPADHIVMTDPEESTIMTIVDDAAGFTSAPDITWLDDELIVITQWRNGVPYMGYVP